VTSPAINPCSGAQVQQTAEAVARHSYGKLVAFLSTRTSNVAAAEDALSEAFAAALEDWPIKGCPSNPEAWLLTVARRKLIDSARRRKNEAPAEEYELAAESVAEAVAEGEIPDRRLGLMFACAHPAIDPAIRAPLMLQAVLGLDAARIASAFLMSPAAMGQRLVRAKTKIRQAGIPLRIPEREELPPRLETVLDAIYAAFSEGWLDAAGTDAARRDLAEEGIYLCRLVISMLPQEPEALGLLALMLYAEARRKARRSADGAYIPLADQNMSLWDTERIAEAEAALRTASTLGVIGRYQLEAAIQSAHVARRRESVNNWAAVVKLYDALLALTESPVAAINRAVALSEAEGPQAGLAALDTVNADPRVRDYQPYWAARADLLARTGARCEARDAYEIAIGLERDDSVRQALEQRRAALETAGRFPPSEK
jgi:RNA polymerase sigma-70 factor (ECF subfamily)